MLGEIRLAAVVSGRELVEGFEVRAVDRGGGIEASLEPSLLRAAEGCPCSSSTGFGDRTLLYCLELYFLSLFGEGEPRRSLKEGARDGTLLGDGDLPCLEVLTASSSITIRADTSHLGRYFCSTQSPSLYC